MCVFVCAFIFIELSNVISHIESNHSEIIPNISYCVAGDFRREIGDFRHHCFFLPKLNPPFNFIFILNDIMCPTN